MGIWATTVLRNAIILPISLPKLNDYSVMRCYVSRHRSVLGWHFWLCRWCGSAMIATVPCSMVVELKALEALRPPRGARSIPPRLPREEYRGPVYPVPSLLATRKAIYTTNSIESLNYQLRTIINNRGHVPFDVVAVKHIERQATQNWQATLGERGGRLLGSFQL